MTYHDLPKELQESYADLDEESKQAPLTWRDGVIRFAENIAVRYAVDHCNLNDMWMEGIRNEWPIQDVMRLYRQMGYSLCGFMEVFTEERLERGHL